MFQEAGFFDGCYHDEQSGKEEEGGPFNALEDVVEFGLADREYGEGEGACKGQNVDWELELDLESEGDQGDEEDGDGFDDEVFADFDVQKFVAEFADEDG